VYFPATDQKAPKGRVESPQMDAYGSGERILVMDDDPVLLSTYQGILEHYGFEVSTASEGGHAAAIYAREKEEGRPFHAVILDLTIVGGMGGKEAAALILAGDPSARIIASSGYSDDPVMAKPASFGFSSAIPKPFSAQELLVVLRGQLDLDPAASGLHREFAAEGTARRTALGSPAMKT
jgi:DNA-binding response OmpR family regulator